MKKRKLILAMYYALIGTSALSVSFTIAWYASASNLKVETIQIQLDTERDLKISLSDDKTTFVDEIFPDEVRQVGVYTPVSTNFTSNWLTAESTEPTLYDLSYYTTDINGVPYLHSAPVGWYYNQDIYLLCDDTVYVGLDAKQTYVRPSGMKNQDYAALLEARDKDGSGKTSEEYLALLNEVVDSSRLGFLIDGEFTVIDPYYSDSVLFGGALDNNRDKYFDYYQNIDDRELYEVFYGECEHRDKLVYDEVLEEDSPEPEIYNAFSARHKKGVHPLNLEKSIENGAEIATETATPLFTLDEDYYPGPMPDFYFELEAFKPKKINLSLYLEGWDLDSINSSMGASFDVCVSFRVIREK